MLNSQFKYSKNLTWPQFLLIVNQFVTYFLVVIVIEYCDIILVEVKIMHYLLGIKMRVTFRLEIDGVEFGEIDEDFWRRLLNYFGVRAR